MKLVRHSRLYDQQGQSDKVYKPIVQGGVLLALAGE